MMEATENADEGFLRCILSIHAIAEHTETEAKNPMLVSCQQRLHAVSISLEAPSHQLSSRKIFGSAITDYRG